ncbi:MAG: hypothetical protein R3244_02775, partial [Thermoanaerobaculia bacterium]|nr:hypothetical protein [Thermoanaerobaculia bacterium]
MSRRSRRGGASRRRIVLVVAAVAIFAAGVWIGGRYLPSGRLAAPEEVVEPAPAEQAPSRRATPRPSPPPDAAPTATPTPRLGARVA